MITDNLTESEHVAHSLLISILRDIEFTHPAETTGDALEEFKTDIARVWAQSVFGSVVASAGLFPRTVTTIGQLQDLCLYHMRFSPDRYLPDPDDQCCTVESMYRDPHGRFRCRKCDPPCSCDDCIAGADEPPSEQ